MLGPPQNTMHHAAAPGLVSNTIPIRYCTFLDGSFVFLMLMQLAMELASLHRILISRRGGRMSSRSPSSHQSAGL